MARARTLKQGFFTNDALGKLRPAVRLLFAGLWTLADRHGRLLDRPLKIKAEVLPYDHVDVDGALDELAQGGFILRYVENGIACIQVVKWAKHQHPHPKEPSSELPAPKDWAELAVVEPLLNTAEQRQNPENATAEPVQNRVRARTGTLTIPSGSWSPVSGTLAPSTAAAPEGEDAPHPGADNDEETNGSTTALGGFCCPFASITNGEQHSEFCTR